MSYISLYRKWRSQTFDEVVGQPAIIQTLKNAIKNQRLAHAYLFSGPRGTGKTSTARILAKALNCEKGMTFDPCGTCANCIKIRDGHSVNVIEIDAASNRGIDEIRQLREQVRYLPVEGRYKVYIIDEVHMLTNEAFNALLKTLEEPPAYTVFVLATTELQKVPLTISSRCQRLDFGRIKLPTIGEHLKKIARSEGFEIEEKALTLICRISDGSMRDAVSLLDQLISFSGHRILYDDVVLLLGTADEDLLLAFGEAIASAKIPEVLGLIKKGIEEGRATLQVTRDLVAHFRNLLHIKVGSGEILELTSDYLQKLTLQANQYSLEKLKEVIKALSRAELDMKWHPQARLVLEIALLELLEGTGLAELEQIVVEEKSPTKVIDKSPLVIEPSNEILSKIKIHWKDILNFVRDKSPFSYISLQEGHPIEINARGSLIIGFRSGYSFHKSRLEDNKNKAVVEEAIDEIVGSSMLVECRMVDHLPKEEKCVSAEAVADIFGGKVIS